MPNMTLVFNANLMPTNQHRREVGVVVGVDGTT